MTTPRTAAPLRLAMVSYGLPVPGQKRGGIERSAHTLADGLARRGHDVVVFTHDDRPAGARYEVRPLPWKRFVNTWAGRRATMGYLGNLLAILPDYREFDAVVYHGDSLLAFATGKPAVRVLHGSALGEARAAQSPGRMVLQFGVYLQELLTGLLYDHVVAVSANTTRSNPFVRYVIPHGFDDAVFTSARGPRTPEPSVLFVGTLDGRKRGQMLLDGFQQTIRPAHPAATLTIVGPAGPPHPGVEYRTGVTDAELAQLYRRAWVYASPSTYEGFGLPYLEAMACGTPVVATPNPGSDEVLAGGVYGLLPDDAAFVHQVSALLADPVRRAVLATSGIERARRYSLTAMLDRYEELLRPLASDHVKSVASA